MTRAIVCIVSFEAVARGLDDVSKAERTSQELDFRF